MSITMEDMVRPISGIENRSAREVFDIMCDRVRTALPAPTDETQGVKREAVTEIERYRIGLEKISAIRNSIIGFQNVGWSDHIYPLVAALEDAGIHGIGYDKARENVRTLLAAEARVETAERLLVGVVEAADQWNTAKDLAAFTRLSVAIDAARTLTNGGENGR